MLVLSLLGLSLFSFHSKAYSLPVGGKILQGNVSLEQSRDQHTLTIKVKNSAVVEFESFNIQPDETVNIVTASPQTTFEVRVTGPGSTQILGVLATNEEMDLVNSHGFAFSQTGSLNASRIHTRVTKYEPSTSGTVLRGTGSFSFAPSFPPPYALLLLATAFLLLVPFLKVPGSRRSNSIHTDEPDTFRNGTQRGELRVCGEKQKSGVKKYPGFVMKRWIPPPRDAGASVKKSAPNQLAGCLHLFMQLKNRLLSKRGLFRKTSRQALIGILCFAYLTFPVFMGLVYGLPTDENVVSGAATIERSQDNSTMNVTASNNTVIEWGGFNVAQSESVNFTLPSADASLLNRIVGGGTSQILGRVTANGTLVLVNQNGFYFGPQSQINAGKFIASAHDITNANFAAGNYLFAGVDAEVNATRTSILNEGTIHASNGGVVLAADAIENRGVIEAPVGMVSLAAGKKVSIGISGDGLISVFVDEPTAHQILDKDGNAISEQIKNSGTLSAQGGNVQLNAQAVSQVFESAINVQGYVWADQAVEGADGSVSITANGNIKMNAEVHAENSTINVESTQDIEVAGGKYEAENGNINFSADKDLTVSGNTETKGRTDFKAAKDVTVNADVTTEDDDLIFEADSDLDGEGTFNQAAGTTLKTTTSGNISISSSGESTIANIDSAGDLSLNKAGAEAHYTQQAGSTVKTAGSLHINEGVTLSAGSSIYEVGRDWHNLGHFDAQLSLVKLVGIQDAVVYGSNTFYDFRVTDAGKIVRFDADEEQDVLGTLTLQGSFGNLLMLRSTEVGVQWKINAVGATELSYLDIMDSSNVNIHGPPLAPGYSKNSQGNTGWEFAGAVWTGNGNNSNWSNGSNWNGGWVPGVGDLVRFTAGAGSSTVDVSFGGSIGGLKLEAGYNGTVTLGRSLTVEGNYEQNAGTFDARDQVLTVHGSFTVSAGTYKMAILNTMNVTGEFTVADNATFNIYVDPVFFGQPADAVEVVELRTESSVTFRRGATSYSAVSFGVPLFTQDENGNLVPVENFGRRHGNTFTFNRLAEGVQVQFDLTQPQYTLTQGIYSYTYRYNSAALGTISNGNSIYYSFSESAHLLWTVDGNNVLKAIFVDQAGGNPDFSFTITTSANLTQSLTDSRIVFLNQNGDLIFRTTAPFLLDENANVLEGNPVELIYESGAYHYQYSTEGLPQRYIIDPSAGPNTGSSVANDTSSGSVSWGTTASNISTSDNTYNTASLFINAFQTTTTYFMKVTGFGFSLGSATVNGITVSVESSFTTSVPAVININGTAKIVKGNTLSGNSKSFTVFTSDNTASMGSSSDLWGTTWTASDIESANFGVGIQMSQPNFTSSMGTTTGRVDLVRITVDYSVPTNITVSGNVYTNEAQNANVGANVTIGISVNGAAKTTTTTDGSGAFSFSNVSVFSNDTVLLFVDNDATYEANYVSQTNATNMTGIAMYTNKIVLSHQTSGPMTNALLVTAAGSADDDIHYTNSGSNITFANGYELFIETSKTYTPGANVTVDDIDINGTFTMGSNSVTVNGTWDATGGSFSSSGTVTFAATSAKTITSNGQSFSSVTFNGVGGSWTPQDTMTVSSAFTLTNGTFDQGTVALNVGGTFTLTSGTFTKSSNASALTFNGTGNIADNTAGLQDLGAVVIGGSSVTRTVTSTSGIKMTSLTINSGNTFDLGGKNFTFSSAAAVTNNGTFQLQGNETLTNVNNLDLDSGTVNYNGTSGTYTVKNFGATDYFNLTISGSVVQLGNDVNIDGALNISGTFYLNGHNINDAPGGATATLSNISGTLRLNDNETVFWSTNDIDSGTWEYVGTNGPYTIRDLGATDYFNLTINSSGITFNVGANLVVAGTLTVTNGTVDTANNNFSAGAINIGASGTFNANSSTITLNATSGTLFTRSGTFNQSNSTVIMNPNASVTLTSGTVTFNNLQLTPTLASSGKTYTFGSSAVAVNGDFTINPSAASSLALTVNLGAGLTVSGLTTITKTSSATSNLSTTGSNYSLSTGRLDIQTGGTLTANSSTITLTGTSGTLFTRSGTFTQGSSTVLFNPDASVTLTSGTITFNNLQINPTITTSRTYTFGSSAITVAGNLTINRSTSSGELTVNLGADLTVTGNLTITAGILDVTTNNYAINLAGNWANTGTFTARNGTVTLNGTNQTISNSTTFYNLTKTVTTARTLTFGAGTTQTILGALTLQGASGQLLSLRSSSTGTQWRIDVQGTSTLRFLDVKDSNNINVTGLTGLDSTNSLNNTNWTFVSSVTISGTVYTAENQSTNVGAGVTIGLSVNGGTKTTTTTGAGGTFSFSGINAGPNTIYLLFVDNSGSYEANYVSISGGGNISGITMFTNKVVISHESAGPITNANLVTAAGSADDDIHYTFSGSNITFDAGYEVYILSGKTYSPGANVTADSLEVVGTGTFNPAANSVTIHSDWTISATGSFTSSGTVTFDGSGNSTVITGGTDASHDFQNFTVNKSGNAIVTLSTNGLDVDGTLTITAGILSMNGQNISTTTSFSNDGTLRLNGSETFSWTSESGTGAIEYVGTGGPYTIANYTYKNLKINGSGATFRLGATLTVTNLTLLAGTLDSNGHDITISGSWTDTGSGHFLPGTNKVTFTGTSGGTPTINANEAFYNVSFTSGTVTLGGAFDVDGGLNITFGVLDVSSNNYTINVAGDFSALSGDNKLIKRNGTIIFDGTSDQTISSVSHLFNVVVNKSAGTVFIRDNDLSVEGNFTITSGTVTILTSVSTGVGYQVNLSGNWSNSGTFNPGTGKVVLNGSNQTLSGNNTFYNLTITGTVTLGSLLDVNNTLTISSSGSLDVSTNNYEIDIAHFWTNSGTFNARNGTVVFDGGNQNIEGTTTFYNLSKTVTTSQTLFFEAGKTQIILNELTLQGASGQLLLLRSLTSGSQWSIDPRGTRTISYADVKDSNNINASAIACNTGCLSSGNIAGWAIQSQITISGNVLNNGSGVGAGVTIALSVAGGAKTTTTTAANSTFSFSNVTVIAGQAVLLLIDDHASYEANYVSSTNGADMTGISLKTNQIILAGTVTNSLLATSTGSGDNNIHYSVSGGNATFNSGYQLTIAGTYVPGGNVTADDINISGTFTMGSNAVNISGSWTTTGSFTSSGVVTFNSIGAKTISSNGNNFSQIVFAGGSWTLQSSLAVTGNLTINSSATLDVSSNNYTINSLSGSWTNNGTFVPRSGTVRFQGTGTIVNNGSFYNLIIGFDNFTHANMTLGSNLDVNGNLTIINSSTLNAANNNYTINVAGNWTNSGTFTAGNSTVILDGSNQTITGDNTFYNLQKTVTSTATLTFTAGSIQGILNNLVLSGTEGNLLLLRSSSDSTQWSISAHTPSVQYVDVKDSNNLNNNSIVCDNCVGSGHNTNWAISGVINISGAVYTNENQSTNVGAGVTIGLSVNGGAKQTAATAADGSFTFSEVNVLSTDVILLFIDNNASYKANYISVAGTNDITDIDMYTNKIVIAPRGSMITNSMLATADNSADNDIHYSMVGNNVVFDSGFELFIKSNGSYRPGGNVSMDDIDIRGVFDTAANAVTVAGSWDVNGGTFTGFGTVTFVSTGSETIKSGGQSFENIAFNGNGGMWTLQDALDVNGSLTIGTNATLDVSASNYSINVAGSWFNSGTFNARNGTVVLDGGIQQTINGSTTFYNFTKQISGSSSFLNFQEGTTQTILGTLTLQGNNNSVINYLELRSSTPGNQWEIDARGPRNVSYLDVRDSNNINATPIDCVVHCSGNANNLGWTGLAISSTPPPAIFSFAYSQTFFLNNQLYSFQILITYSGAANFVMGNTMIYTMASSNGIDVFMNLMFQTNQNMTMNPNNPQQGSSTMLHSTGSASTNEKGEGEPSEAKKDDSDQKQSHLEKHEEQGAQETAQSVNVHVQINFNVPAAEIKVQLLNVTGVFQHFATPDFARAFTTNTSVAEGLVAVTSINPMGGGYMSTGMFVGMQMAAAVNGLSAPVNTNINAFDTKDVLAPTFKINATAQPFSTRFSIIAKADGKVEVKINGGDWQPAQAGMVLRTSDEVRTLKGGSANIVMDDKGATGNVQVESESRMRFDEMGQDSQTGEKKTVLAIAVGGVKVHVAQKLKGHEKFEVKTPNSTVGVRGTTFRVQVDPQSLAVAGRG